MGLGISISRMGGGLCRALLNVDKCAPHAQSGIRMHGRRIGDERLKVFVGEGVRCERSGRHRELSEIDAREKLDKPWRKILLDIEYERIRQTARRGDGPDGFSEYANELRLRAPQ